MQDSRMVLCPLCLKGIPEGINACPNCGHLLYGMKVAGLSISQDRYRIIHDGIHYGVGLGEVIIIHGLELDHAIRIRDLLNDINVEETG